MNWVKTNERLPEANNDYYVVSVTGPTNTFLAIAYYLKHDNKWYYLDKGRPGEEVVEKVNAWIENIGLY